MKYMLGFSSNQEMIEEAELKNSLDLTNHLDFDYSESHFYYDIFGLGLEIEYILWSFQTSSIRIKSGDLSINGEFFGKDFGKEVEILSISSSTKIEPSKFHSLCLKHEICLSILCDSFLSIFSNYTTPKSESILKLKAKTIRRVLNHNYLLQKSLVQ
ncbi:hypothetical protein BpHYR1_044839 [Brachionus plicatilis]|uniref:Uncharacterized protein n=1 Tax=Brachionus plicatilis TaxID=10195 RepID=A0A3M7RAK9_BRAPC|nr:hypothetical protein BpHYR1_044839 [Brachionus plicatilis]